jgi:hypothetical protein
MGCCCSTETEAEADANYAEVDAHSKLIEEQPSKWIEEQPCQCPEEYYFTTNLIWEVVPIVAVVSSINYMTFTNTIFTQFKVFLL